MKISQLTDYDKEVNRAIHRLYTWKNKIITDSMIYGAMNFSSQDSKEEFLGYKFFLGEIKKIKESVEKLRETVYSDEKYHVKKRVLNLMKCLGQIGETKCIFYQMLDEPINLDN